MIEILLATDANAETEALYINGYLKRQAHDLSTAEVVEELLVAQSRYFPDPVDFVTVAATFPEGIAPETTLGLAP